MPTPDLHALALRLCAVSLKYDIALSTQYLGRIFVAGADGLSSMDDDYSCVLKASMFRKLWVWTGSFDVDCCCSPEALQPNPHMDIELPMVSPLMKGALHRNVLTFRHVGRLYAFPPAPIIAALVAHVRREKLRMVMVVPEWPTQPWYTAAMACKTLWLGEIGSIARVGKAGLGPLRQMF